jgi:hypothetical protein
MATSGVRPTPRSGAAHPSTVSSPPRSAPSPAFLATINQQKSGKTPYKQPGSSVNTPTAAAMINTPSALSQGIGSSPLTMPEQQDKARGVLSNAGTPGLAGLALTLPTPNLQFDITAGVQAPTGEELATHKEKQMANMLGARWGWVSQEGVERCAKRVGLECLWEDDSEGKRTLNIAGQMILIELDWIGQRVADVRLDLPGAEAKTTVGRGAETLKQNLTGDGGHFVPLERFASNLSVLARLDQLSKEGVSCFEALEGVHGSLKRIWEWELKMYDGQASKQASVETKVLSQGSGRPSMHTGGTLGLRVDYWLDKRLVTSKKRKLEDEAESSLNKKAKRWALSLECETTTPAYPPIRLSNKWVSDAVEKPNATDAVSKAASFSNMIDWLEPAQSFSATDGGEADPIAMIESLPKARFIAKLNPPVILPYQTADEMLKLLGQPIGNPEYMSYSEFLFPKSPTKGSVQRQRIIPGPGGQHSVNISLSLPPQAWARKLVEVPFVHPKDLILILPILRQWAFIGRLLQQSLGIDAATASNATQDRKPLTRKGQTKRNEPLTPPSDTDSDEEPELEDARPEQHTEISLGLSFEALPAANLQWQIVSPGKTPKSGEFRVLPNAAIEAGLQNGSEDWCKRLESVFEISEDFGVLSDWINK